MKSLLYIFFSLFLSGQCFAQDFTWWNEKHDYDGVSNWNQYLIVSPAFFGPNALPVPEILNAKMKGNVNLQIAAEGHFSKGDQTEDLYFELYTPIVKDVVVLNLSGVMLEHYKMDTLTRDLRRSRDFDGEGFAGGDIYISTLIQVLKDKEKWPDIMLSINLRTASGTNLEGVRYTDAPGYYFDGSFGKDIEFEGRKLQSIRPHGMGGFYVWQTYSSELRQNDAFSFGLGLDLEFQKVRIKNAAGGYLGYINNGDKPIVYRFDLESKLESNVNYGFRFQQGLNDFEYSTFRFSFNFNLDDLFKKN